MLRATGLMGLSATLVAVAACSSAADQTPTYPAPTATAPPVATASPTSTPSPVPTLPPLTAEPPATPAPPPTVPTPVPTIAPPIQSTPAACTVQAGMYPCDQCVVTRCCAQIQACDSNQDCVAIDQCSQRCDAVYGQSQLVEQCYRACDNAHPVGLQYLNQVIACEQSACAQFCY